MIKYGYNQLCEPFATLPQKQSLWQGTVFSCSIRGIERRNQRVRWFRRPHANLKYACAKKISSRFADNSDFKFSQYIYFWKTPISGFSRCAGICLSAFICSAEARRTTLGYFFTISLSFGLFDEYPYIFRIFCRFSRTSIQNFG